MPQLKVDGRNTSTVPALTEAPTFTDEQRAALLQFFAAHPKAGYKTALALAEAARSAA